MTIIDGDNLLWALRQTPEEREIATELELCRALSRYFALTGESGQNVFAAVDWQHVAAND